MSTNASNGNWTKGEQVRRLILTEGADGDYAFLVPPEPKKPTDKKESTNSEKT